MKTKIYIISTMLMILLMIAPALALDHYLAQSYDVNENGIIDTTELQTAIVDENNGIITEPQLDDLTYFWVHEILIEDP
jgi:hypothetical protein